MDLSEYQRKALEFDQVPGGPDAILVALLGLAGETGELLSEYKRNARAHQVFHKHPGVESPPSDVFPEVVKEELGDILWYASNLASKFGLDLGDVANGNLKKLDDRYRSSADSRLFDDNYPESERLPRQFEVLFLERQLDGRTETIVMRADGKTLGNELTDNAHFDDGYRFHDVFHFAFATMLGWSPVTRKFMRTKRVSKKTIDEIEDGGRAWVYEEAISLLIFDFAKRHNLFRDVISVDGRLLREIKNLTGGIEVRVRSRREWEIAIQEGFRIWHLLREHNGGWVQCDLSRRSMQYREASTADKGTITAYRL